MTKTIQAADGTDITEPVQILYDIAHSSLDWGSGFLDNEEMEAVIGLAVLMGWRVPDLPDITSMRSPMVTVAQKFPDHYEIEEIVHPPNPHHPAGWTSRRIKTIPQVTA